MLNFEADRRYRAQTDRWRAEHPERIPVYRAAEKQARRERAALRRSDRS